MQHETMNAETATETPARVTLMSDDLWRAAKLLSSKAIDKRQTIPVLAAIRFDIAPDGACTLTATDKYIFASVTLEASTMGECVPGSFAIDGKALADAMAKARKSRDYATLEQESIEAGGYRVNLKAGRTALKLPALPVDDFPLTPTVGIDAGRAEFDAQQFLADMKALAPAMSKEEARYYLQGVAIQRRELAGRERLCLVATCGKQMVAASRPIPQGLEAMPDIIAPRAFVEFLNAAGKVAQGVEGLALSVESARIAATLGNVSIVSKVIDGTFPEWPRAFDMVSTPTGGIEGPLFPELLPGRPIGQMVTLEKAFPGAIEWTEGEEGMLGSCNADSGIAWAVTRGKDEMQPKKGYTFEYGGHDRARDYLKALAEQQGLPSADAMESECERFNEASAKVDVMTREGRLPVANARMESRGHVQYVGKRIVGLTVAAKVKTREWYETVQDWQTLSTREITHEATESPLEGSYSVLMPADGPQLEAEYSVTVAGDQTYPIATNGTDSLIHLDKAQVAALCGDELWQVLEFPGADGKPRYVSQWVWDNGDARLLCVGKDGKTTKAGAVREYVTREQVEAALAGEPMAQEAAETVTPTCDAECVGATCDTEASPQEAQESAAPAIAPDDSGEGPQSAPSPVSGQPETQCAATPIADIRARLAEIEALLASLPTQSVETARPKRTAAHERAIRRAWEMRRQLRAARYEARLQRDMAAKNARSLQTMRDDLDKRQHSLEAALATAQDHLTKREALQVELRRSERQREAAEAENAQLWQEIESLTAPAERQAA